MVPTFQSVSARTGSRLLGALAALSAVAAAFYVLFPDPLADAFFAGWVLFGVALSVVGAVGAWTNRTPLVWAAALLMTGLAIAGMWSIGRYVAPAALLLLGSALLSHLTGPREGVREAIAADPPTVRETALKTLVGAGSVVVGSGLVYAGALARELFGACADETLACAVEAINWGAVVPTVVGLLAVGFGGWLVWKQLYVARVLASESAG